MKNRLIWGGLLGVVSLLLIAMYVQPVPETTTGTFSAEKLAEAQRNVERYVDEGKLAGVLTLVAHRGQVIHQHAYGVRDLETQAPMDFDTIFRLASMTKPLTSVALMMLYEEGAVQLEDPVAQYLPAFAATQVYTAEGRVPPTRPVTVKDALMHTMGLTAQARGFGRGPVAELYDDADLGAPETLAALTERLAGLPLAHQPGTDWTYGYSTDVVARIVEVVSGEPLDAFVHTRILEPLGMEDTGYVLPASALPRVASAYTAMRGEGLQVAIPARTSAVRYPRGATGLLGTTGDYLRFAQMLLNGGELDGVRLLKPETVALMTRNHLPQELVPIGVMGLDMINNGFGLGFGVVVDDQPGEALPNGFWWNQHGKPAIGSYWWIGSLQTYFWVDPTHEIIGMVMAQSIDMPFPYKQEFHTMVYDAYEPNTAP